MGISLSEKNTAEKRELLFKVLILLITIAAFIPFVLATRYAIFHTDDFNTCVNTFAMPGNSYFVKSLYKAHDNYMTWQGTYTYNWMSSFFNPLRWYSFSYCRLLLMGLLSISFFSTLFLCREIASYYKLKDSLYLFILVFLPMLLFREYDEVYLWFVGAMNYFVPCIFLILGLALMLRCRRRQSVLSAVLSGTALILMAGGVLMVGGMGACFVLLLLVLDWVENGKPDKKFLVLFVVTFIGDLINALAPGNFAKHTEFGEFDVFASLSASIKAVMQESGFLLGHTAFSLFIVCAFFLGWTLNRRIKKEKLIIAVIGLLGTPFVTAFPMMLGYNGSDVESMPIRGLFVLDIALIIGYEGTALLLASQLRACGFLKKEKIVRTAALVLVVVILAFNVSGIGNSIPVQISENLANGKIEKFSSGWHEIFDMMRARPGEDIVLVELPEDCVGTLEFDFGAYPTHSVNMAMSRYFGNNSICTAWYIATQGGLLEEPGITG